LSWLTGWRYRKSHVINPASGAGTNYQIKITVHYGSGTDSGEHVYLNGKCRTDFGDIRFTRSDGITLLDYWMERKVDGDNAVFWVEVADDLSTTSQTIYIYYGNPSATTTSNGDNTFLLFDHFEGTTLDSSKWSLYWRDSQVSYSVSNSILTIECNSSQSVWVGLMIRSLSTFGVNKAIEARVQYVYSQTYPNSYRHLGFVDSSGGLISLDTRLAVADNYVQVYYLRAAWVSGYSEQGLENRKDASTVGVVFSGTWNTWLRAEITWYSTKTTAVEGGTLKASNTSNVPTVDMYVGIMLARGANSGDAKIQLDWIAVRKYVDPEPSHGAWGSEETVAIIETIVAKNFPMDYLPSPIKAEQLISKVSGATIQMVSQDYPLTMIKSGKAEELKSKWM
jgi:hypothetical protein